jgi:hypothetical protein
MAIDYSALLGLTAGLHVATVDYDFDRDGGAVGVHTMSGDVVPDGSLLIAFVTLTTKTMVYTGNGQGELRLGDAYITNPQDAAGEATRAWDAGNPATVVSGDKQPSFAVVTDVCTAGAFTAWLLYVPT